MGKRAVFRQRVVRVLGDDLRSPATEDLDRPRAADWGPSRWTTSRIAPSRSDGANRSEPLPAPDGPDRPVNRGAAQSSVTGSHASQQAPAGVGAARSPKCASRAVRRHWRRSTKSQIARYWSQRARSASRADARHAASARRSQLPTTRPATRSGGDGSGTIKPARHKWPMIARTPSSSNRAFVKPPNSDS